MHTCVRTQQSTQPTENYLYVQSDAGDDDASSTAADTQSAMHVSDPAGGQTGMSTAKQGFKNETARVATVMTQAR